MMQRLIKEKPEFASVLIVVIIQLCLGVWWAADLNRRVCNIEEWRSLHTNTLIRLTKMETDYDTHNKDLTAIRAGIDRLEVKLSEIQKAVWTHVGDEGKRAGKP